jgi:hypothetical protein
MNDALNSNPILPKKKKKKKGIPQRCQAHLINFCVTVTDPVPGNLTH